MNPARRQFVFGYGSLTARSGWAARCPTRELRGHGFIADVAGLRRTWGVAMDNRRDLSGYKYYTDATGLRLEVFVAYLDLLPAPEQAMVNGLCLPVDEPALARLDRRERNYVRTDISDRIVAATADARGIRVWAYIGSRAARDRLAEGRRTGTAVIDSGYVRTVEAGFSALGEEELDACRASLEPDGLPVVELTRHELP